MVLHILEYFRYTLTLKATSVFINYCNMIAVIRGPVYLFTYKVLKLTRQNERARMEEGVHFKRARGTIIFQELRYSNEKKKKRESVETKSEYG